MKDKWETWDVGDVVVRTRAGAVELTQDTDVICLVRDQVIDLVVALMKANVVAGGSVMRCGGATTKSNDVAGGNGDD